MADIVIDASAMVDALAGTAFGPAVTARLRDHTLHAHAHFDAEVLSALGRLQRAGALSVRQVRTRLGRLQAAEDLRPSSSGSRQSPTLRSEPSGEYA